MRIIFLWLLIIVFCACNRSIDTEESSNFNKADISVELKDFPKDWLGYWEGELNVYDHAGKKMSIPMALDNAPTDNDSTWIWAIIYGEDTIAGRRDYQLKLLDYEKGHYAVDEKNSILIDAFVLDNSLVSTFTVAGNFIQSRYELHGDEMIFSIQMFRDEKIRISGDTIYNGEDIPLVECYRNTIWQKARLKKIR